MRFSVTIPAYKVKYLKEAIDSVLAQTFQDFELIVVNDASPFDIDSVLSQYNDSRIVYKKNEKNCGAKNVVDNWNISLSYATGDYLICMGDDDRLCPNCLQDYANAIEKHPDFDIFHAGTEVIDEQSQFVESLEIRAEYESVFSLIYSTQGSGLGSYLYKLETLRKNGGFYKLPYGWASDFISEYIAAKSYGIVNVQSVGFQYRGNALSISHDMDSIEDKLLALLDYEKWVVDFVSNSNVTDENDKLLCKHIMDSIDYKSHKSIDGLIEFDIRKNFYRRGCFWFGKRRKYGVTFARYMKCVVKALLYRIM